MRGIEIAAQPINLHSRTLEDTSAMRNLVSVPGLLRGWDWGRGRRRRERHEIYTQRTIQGLIFKDMQ